MKTFTIKHGKIEITEENDTHITFITEEGEEKRMIKRFVTLYTEEECNEILEEREDENTIESRYIKHVSDTSAEIFRANAMKNLPSSMRR